MTDKSSLVGIVLMIFPVRFFSNKVIDWNIQNFRYSQEFIQRKRSLIIFNFTI